MTGENVDEVFVLLVRELRKRLMKKTEAYAPFED